MRKLKKYEIVKKIQQLLPNAKITKFDKHGLICFEELIIGSLEGYLIFVERDDTVNVADKGKDTYHVALNPWLYGDMDFGKVKSITKIMLKTFPDALLFTDDDTSVDYNENSMLKSDEVNYYTIKGTMSEFYRLLKVMKKELDPLIGQAPFKKVYKDKTKLNFFAFTEWVAQTHTLTGTKWTHKYTSSEDKANTKTTEELYNIFVTRK